MINPSLVCNERRNILDAVTYIMDFVLQIGQVILLLLL